MIMEGQVYEGDIVRACCDLWQKGATKFVCFINPRTIAYSRLSTFGPYLTPYGVCRIVSKQVDKPVVMEDME